MQGQRGNILFLILLAVILFAALSYAVTNSMKGGGSDASSESASATASDVIQHWTGIRAALQRLRLTNNCTDTQISFDYNNGATSCLTTETPATGYENANSPTNCKCHLFHPLGGGMSWRDPASYKFPSTATMNAGTIRFVGKTAFRYLGSDAAELYTALMVPVTAQTASMDRICQAYNDNVGASGINATIASNSVYASPLFTGTYETGSYTLSTDFYNLPAACHRYSTTHYLFFFTLLER